VRSWVKLPDIQWHTMQQFEHNRIADAARFLQRRRAGPYYRRELPNAGG